MKLSPTDINNKEFKKGIRGYSIDEVDEFLDKIVESYEEIFKENEILKENLSRVNEKLDHESIGNANETAQRILDKAHGDVIAINDEYERVREEFIKFRAKFRGFMNTQLQTFDELEKDLTKNYNVSQTVDQYELHEKEAEIYNESEKDEFKIEDLNDDIDAIKKFYSNN